MFSKFKSILCLDGELPSVDFFKSASLPIIAADGAANTLMQMGVLPQIVIGDLDSIASDFKKTLNTLHRPDQNSCDYEKSLAYLQANDLLPSIICGTNGGQLDHILNNINLFAENDNLLLSHHMMGLMLREKSERLFKLALNTKISIFGAPHAIVTSEGLEWELENYAMNFFGKNSCFNRTKRDDVLLRVVKGSALVLIHCGLDDL